MVSAELERFLARVDKTDSCWLWTGGQSGPGYERGVGYAAFYWSGRMGTAHRYSYAQFVGPIPDGLWVLHKCDVRRCVNPDHLFLGTVQDNHDDMWRKNRGWRGGPKGNAAVGDRNGSRTHPHRRVKGERCWSSKLSAGQVAEIRRLHTTGGYLHRELAALFGVATASVTDILARRTWKHVP